jgi:sec-independent protein translocase protein TatC
VSTSRPISTNEDYNQALEKYMPFLIEIRKRLLFTISVFLIATTVGFIYYKQTTQFIIRIFSIEGLNIVFTSPFQFLTLAVNSGLLVGFIAVLPLLIMQILNFLKPALNPKEYKIILGLLPASIFLFILGFSSGVMIMKWMVVLFFKNSQDLNVGNFLDINNLFSQILMTGILMGVGFQFPIVLTFLMGLKLIKYETLVKQRLWAHMTALIFAALLPPTDLLSLFLMYLPLALLFEITLLLNRLLFRNNLK